VPSGTQVTITRYGLVNADYHWRYRAKDIIGATSDWTEFGAIGNIDFRVSVPTPNQPPYTPYNPSPSNHATGVSIYVDLSWSGGDPDAGDTVTYDVYFGVSPSPPLVSSGQSSTTYDLGTLSYSTTYYWKIVAKDNHGAITSGPVWDFTTQTAPPPPNQPPYTPYNPSPLNHATAISIYPDLSWSGGDPDVGDTVTYDVYFGTSTSPPLVSNDQSATTYDPDTLSYGITYYWKIVATDNHGASTEGPIWDFTTQSAPPNQPPYAPAAVSQFRSDGVTVIPEGGTTPESTVVFKATVSDPDGDSVRLEIELRQMSESFTGEPTPETISDYVPSGTQVTITRYGLVNAEYHWRYRAKDSHGATSDWVEFGAIGNVDFKVRAPTPVYGKGVWIWMVWYEATYKRSVFLNPDGSDTWSVEVSKFGTTAAGICFIEQHQFTQGVDYSEVKVDNKPYKWGDILFVPEPRSILISIKISASHEAVPGTQNYTITYLQFMDVYKVISRLKSARVSWITIKCGDSNSYYLSEGRKMYYWPKANNYKDFNEMVMQFHAAGIKVLGWQYVYGKDRYGIPGVTEADVADKILSIAGIDGLIIDAEPPYDGTENDAQNYLESIRKKHPDDFIAYTSIRGGWDFHKLFTKYCDACMPQAYWAAREPPLDPKKEFEKMEEEWRCKDYKTPVDKWNKKPIIPVGQGGRCEYGVDVKKGEITTFCELLLKNGYAGVSLW
jgi:hypothetical protein